MKWIVLASLMMVSHLAQEAEVGTTVFTRGEVNATQDDTVRVLARRSPIYQQEHVTTGTDARAVLKLSDDTVVTLGEKASFRLAEYVFNEEEKRALLEIPVGAFRIITGKLTKNENPSFKVSTARSTIEVRGITALLSTPHLSLSTRPPRMAEVQKLQEHISASTQHFSNNKLPIEYPAPKEQITPFSPA